MPPISLQPKASELVARTLFNVPPARSIRKAKPLESLNSLLAGNSEAIGEARKAKGEGMKGVHGVEQPRSK